MSNASELPPQVEQSINSFVLGQHAPQPLDVIIERDGNYPDFACVLAQLDLRAMHCNAGADSIPGC